MRGWMRGQGAGVPARGMPAANHAQAAGGAWPRRRLPGVARVAAPPPRRQAPIAARRRRQPRKGEASLLSPAPSEPGVPPAAAAEALPPPPTRRRRPCLALPRLTWPYSIPDLVLPFGACSGARSCGALTRGAGAGWQVLNRMPRLGGIKRRSINVGRAPLSPSLLSPTASSMSSAGAGGTPSSAGSSPSPASPAVRVSRLRCPRRRRLLRCTPNACTLDPKS